MIEYYISSTKYSLQERMTRRGKVYDVVFRIVTLDGIEKQKKLSGYFTKTLAKEAYTKFVTEKCELVKNNSLKKKNPEKQELLVGDLFREYMSTLGNQNKESVIYDKNHLSQKFILPYYKNSKITELTKEELYKWQDILWASQNTKTGEYFSYSYLKKIRSLMFNFLNWVERRYEYRNNLYYVDRPKKQTTEKEIAFWTREEFEKFISVVDEPLYHALFTFMFFTGRRKGELFALYSEDVKSDFIRINKSVTRKTIGKETWKITSTKANKTCTIPVCSVVKKEIELYKPQGKFYFGGKRPLAETTVTRVFNRYIELAEVKKIRIHDLRHSFVSMLIHLGANFMVVADLISDNLEQVIKTYGHLYQEDKLSVISKI